MSGPEDALRRHDPDRYLTMLFAPADRRDTLITLYAFNHELARAWEAAREPGLALIRLQWWREVVEGTPRGHEVAAPLHQALANGTLQASDLLAMIEAREQEGSTDIISLADWIDWLRLGPGSLAVAAGRALGAPDRELDRLRALGAGYGVAGQLRSIAAFARQGRCLLPSGLLADLGPCAEAVIADPNGPALAPVRNRLGSSGRELLGRASPAGRSWIAAALPAILARRDLERHQMGPRGIADRLAVAAGAWRGQA